MGGARSSGVALGSSSLGAASWGHKGPPDLLQGSQILRPAAHGALKAEANTKARAYARVPAKNGDSARCHPESLTRAKSWDDIRSPAAALSCDGWLLMTDGSSEGSWGAPKDRVTHSAQLPQDVLGLAADAQCSGRGPDRGKARTAGDAE